MAATVATIAEFDNVFDAGYFRALLEDQGFHVAAADEEVVAVEWLLHGGVGNIKLQVPAAEAARAKELMAELRRRPPEREADPRAARASAPRRALLAGGAASWPASCFSRPGSTSRVERRPLALSFAR